MDIKLKSKIKNYLSNIWLIEIIIVILVGIYLGVDFYNGYKNNTVPRIITLLESTFDSENFYMKDFEEDATEVMKTVYSDYFSTYLISSEFLNPKEPYNIFSNKNNYNGYDIYYIIKNKETQKVITNDLQFFGAIENSSTDIDIEEYINEKFSDNDMILKYDNENTFSPALTNSIGQYKVENLHQCEEYYYVNVDEYSNINDKRITYISVIFYGCIIALILKISIIAIRKKGKINLRGDFISYFIYVLKYGFKYKHTRKILVLTIVALAIFYVGYLYSLALGGYENNILVKFLSRYPFKASILLMLLPLIGVVYSIKKSIEISLVNDEIKAIDEGIVDDVIYKDGSSEIKELINNISQIKGDYKLAVEEIINSEKIKTELITNVSHDLRTPLTSIINYVNILQESELTEDERKDYLQILDQKSKKLKILIDDLFEMSKINSGKMALNKEKIDIVSLIYQAIGEYSSLYQEKNIEFNVESDDEEINMLLDGKLISRAIENIVINALKYSLENTRIYVDIKVKDEYIVLAFKNVANYKMEFDDNEVFERFVRGDKSRNSNIDGSGLGLAITKSIVELHEGFVEIKREGDMFKIYLYLPKNQ